jgi:Fe2+ transport system protein FeoA
MTRTTLDRLAPGQSAVIVAIDGTPAIARRLMELGLAPGTSVELVRRAPLGDPLELRVRRVHLSIRGSEAAHIRVDPA